MKTQRFSSAEIQQAQEAFDVFVEILAEVAPNCSVRSVNDIRTMSVFVMDYCCALTGLEWNALNTMARAPEGLLVYLLEKYLLEIGWYQN